MCYAIDIEETQFEVTKKEIFMRVRKPNPHNVPMTPEELADTEKQFVLQEVSREGSEAEAVKRQEELEQWNRNEHRRINEARYNRGEVDYLLS